MVHPMAKAKIGAMRNGRMHNGGQQTWNQNVGKRLVGQLHNRSRHKLEIGMLWLLRTPFWVGKLGGTPYQSFSEGEFRHRLKARGMRLLVKACGAEVGKRLGWHKWATELHFGPGVRFSTAKLVYTLQELEKTEFETWVGFKHGLHPAPLGVRKACMAAMPALMGKNGLPALPVDITHRVLHFVICSSYQDYLDGPTGARGCMVGQCPLVENPSIIGLHTAFMRCAWCDAHLPHGKPMHIVQIN